MVQSPGVGSSKLEIHFLLLRQYEEQMAAMIEDVLLHFCHLQFSVLHQGIAHQISTLNSTLRLVICTRLPPNFGCG